MRRSAAAWFVLVHVFLGWGCSTKVPPADPVATAMARQASSSSVSPMRSPLLEPQTENKTFVIVDGFARYKIGPGDVLDILLTKGFTQEKHTVKVTSIGVVTVAFFNAKVKGLTTDQAAEEIHRTMSPFYKQLSVEVLIKEYNSKKAAVFGAVKGRPGVYPLKGRTTLLDLLAQAGGPAPTANLEGVRLIRPGGQSYTVNLHLLLANGTPARDIEVVLDTGDVVFFPSVEDKRVFVMGEVMRPGAVPMVPHMRLSQAVAQVGGAKDTAVLDSARVIRGNLDQPQILAVDFESLLEAGDVSHDLRLEANDVVFFPRNAIGDWNAFMEVMRPTLTTINLLFRPVIDTLILRDLLNQ